MPQYCNTDGTEMVETTDPDHLESYLVPSSGYSLYICPVCERGKTVMVV